MVIVAFICLTVFSIACLVGVFFVVCQTLREASVIARSQQEAATKYTTAMSQAALLISKNIDERVAGRVKQINTLRNPGDESDDDPLDDAPQDPSLYVSRFLNDDAERERERDRYRREGTENVHVRDFGVGVEDL